MLKRRLFRKEGLDDPKAPWNMGGPFKSVRHYRGEQQDSVFEGLTGCVGEGKAEANLISSIVDEERFGQESLHAPVLDLDVPAYLVPSKTPGHSHLYIDKPMTWYEYEGLLRALERAGVLEPGYVAVAKQLHMTAVRLRPQDRPPRGV